MRPRPILMTAFAFCWGAADGNHLRRGAGAQRFIGIGVLGGMAASAVVGMLLVPVLYVAVVQTTQMIRRCGTTKASV